MPILHSLLGQVLSKLLWTQTFTLLSLTDWDQMTRSKYHYSDAGVGALSNIKLNDSAKRMILSNWLINCSAIHEIVSSFFSVEFETAGEKLQQEQWSIKVQTLLRGTRLNMCQSLKIKTACNIVSRVALVTINQVMLRNGWLRERLSGFSLHQICLDLHQICLDLHQICLDFHQT